MGRAFNAFFGLALTLQCTQSAQTVHAERWWLKDAYGAYPNTLEVLHAFTVAVATPKEDGVTNVQGKFGVDGDLAVTDLPDISASSKAGETSSFWSKVKKETTVNFVGPVTTDSAIKSQGLQLSVIHSSEYDSLAKGSLCVTKTISGKEYKVLETTAEDVDQGFTAQQKADTGANKKIKPSDNASQANGSANAKHAWSWRLGVDFVGDNEGKARPKASPKNAEQAAANGGYSVALSGKIAVLTKPGVYYVTMSNCDFETESKTKFLSGEIEMKSPYGYLPGEELPKLRFYGWLAIIYLGFSVFWGMACARWAGASPAVLLPIHRWIGYGFLTGVFESICWYISLYHWNMIGHRWWSMIFLACFSTLAKQGTCIACLLAVCMGSGITKPHLDRKTVIKICLLVVAFVVTDGARAFEMYTISAGNNSMAWFRPPRKDQLDPNEIGKQPGTSWGAWFTIFLIVSPGTFFLCVLICWAVEELEATIKGLVESGQTIKLQVYQDLRVCLVTVGGVGLCLLGYETWVVREQPLSVMWSQRWIFSDLLTHVAFLLSLLACAFLWRPSERMAQMAFSTQLGPKGDANPNGMGMGGDVEMVGGSLDDVVDDLKPTYDDDDVQDERVKV